MAAKQAHLTPTELEPLQYVWSIGLYQGSHPLALAPSPRPNPVLHAGMVDDIEGGFVADPFVLAVDGRHHLFCEVWNNRAGRGEVACAASADAMRWTYGGVVLREPCHLSYPCVLREGDDFYMIPETREAAAIRLYRADDFPHRWKLVAELLRGDFADATPFFHEGRWWLFAHRGLDELRLYFADALAGPWREHPASPLVAGNRRVSRPAGRVIAVGGRILRFAQDAWPHYGSRVRALEIEELTPERYAEREVPESPLLEASGQGWNALGMHHVELIRRADDDWLAIVDGYTPASQLQAAR